MKKTLILFVCAILATLSALAEQTPPRLACESLFSNKSIRNENTQVVINTTEKSYFRSFKVNGDPQLVKLIEEKVIIDRKRASETVEKYDGSDTYRIILNIPNGEYIINVGFTKINDTDATLFVEAPLKAFE